MGPQISTASAMFSMAPGVIFWVIHRPRCATVSGNELCPYSSITRPPSRPARLLLDITGVPALRGGVAVRWHPLSQLKCPLTDKPESNRHTSGKWLVVHGTGGRKTTGHLSRQRQLSRFSKFQANKVS